VNDREWWVRNFGCNAIIAKVWLVDWSLYVYEGELVFLHSLNEAGQCEKQRNETDTIANTCYGIECNAWALFCSDFARSAHNPYNGQGYKVEPPEMSTEAMFYTDVNGRYDENTVEN
jgi:hypothetical protein